MSGGSPDVEWGVLDHRPPPTRRPIRGRILALAALLLLGLGSACATTAEREREAAPPVTETPATEDPTTSGNDPAPEVPPVETPETGDPADGLHGAVADIPDAVILEELRLTAERIARELPPAAPVPVDVDPRSNRGLGYRLMLSFGFTGEQWAPLDALWQRESGWSHLAENRSSGAYGIPQSLPATKMAVVGGDWRTNPETQIRWGLAYIRARYGDPQRAWEHSQRHGWY